MTYESVAGFVQTWNLVYFVILFAVVLAYAFWPKNGEHFERAANIPLNEED